MTPRLCACASVLFRYKGTCRAGLASKTATGFPRAGRRGWEGDSTSGSGFLGSNLRNSVPATLPSRRPSLLLTSRDGPHWSSAPEQARSRRAASPRGGSRSPSRPAQLGLKASPPSWITRQAFRGLRSRRQSFPGRFPFLLLLFPLPSGNMT